MICVPHASRRRSKWYVKLRRSRHLVVWVALGVTLVVVLGYGTARFIKKSRSDQPVVTQDQPLINPKFNRKN